MQFQFPQFIETKTNVVGPFTIVQFLWLAAGGAIIFMLQFLIQGYTFYVTAFFIAAISAGLAFLKINDLPLPKYIGKALVFLIGKKRYLYKQKTQAETEDYTTPIMQVRDENNPWDNLDGINNIENTNGQE